MAARVSQAGVLAALQGTPKFRASQAGVLAALVGTPKARSSQAGVLAVQQGTPKARASQVGLLVVVPSATAGLRRYANLDGLGAAGSYFVDPLGA